MSVCWSGSNCRPALRVIRGKARSGGNQAPLACAPDVETKTRTVPRAEALSAVGLPNAANARVVTQPPNKLIVIVSIVMFNCAAVPKRVQGMRVRVWPLEV